MSTRTALESLQRSPDPLAMVGRGLAAPSLEPQPRSRPFWPRASAISGRSFVPLHVRDKISLPQKKLDWRL